MVQEIVKGATFNGVNGAKRQKKALIVRSTKKMAIMARSAEKIFVNDSTL